MRTRNFRVLALLVTAALALTSCAKLPTNSEVRVGSDIQSELSSDYLYYSPSDPVEGASAKDILDGFLNAATGPQNDYEVARKFLSRNLAADWNPSAELLVGNTKPVIEFVNPSSATVAFQTSARVDELGRYQEIVPSISRVLNFSLIQENGQWRIDKAPNVILLVRPIFDVLFKSYSLYFYDNQERYLVPDTRWFATRISTSTRLASALLSGPDFWLRDAVRSAFPEETKLALDSVLVQDGVAIVDLDASANSTTISQRQKMLVQLTATLTQLANVFSVQIKIDGVPQNITNLPYQVSLANNPDPIVLGVDGFRQLSIEATPMTRATEAAQDWQAYDFGINNQQTLLALLGPQGVGLSRLVGAKTPTVPIDLRPDLLSPAIDPQGYIWSLGALKDSQLLAFDSSGKQRFAALGWLGQGEHLGFSISREGSRIAVLINIDGVTRLFVAAIVRDANGVPVGLATPIRLGLAERLVSSVAFVDESTVATIARSDLGLSYPIYLKIGGQAKRLAPVANARSVVSNGPASPAYVLDSKQELRSLRSLTWVNIAQDILAIHFSG
ncbi:MAG: hypothetical protein RIR24_519 [Actinomycetota bacterium]